MPLTECAFWKGTAMKKRLAAISAIMMMTGCANGVNTSVSEVPEGATLLRIYSAGQDSSGEWYITASRPMTGDAETDIVTLRVSPDITAGFQAQGAVGGRLLTEYSGAEELVKALQERGNTGTDCTFTLENGVIISVTEINDYMYNDVTGQNFCAQYAGTYQGSPNGAELVLGEYADWSVKYPDGSEQQGRFDAGKGGVKLCPDSGEIILLDRTDQDGFRDSSGNVYTRSE